RTIAHQIRRLLRSRELRQPIDSPRYLLDVGDAMSVAASCFVVAGLEERERCALRSATVFSDQRGNIEQENGAAVEQRIEHGDVLPYRPVTLGVRDDRAKSLHAKIEKSSGDTGRKRAVRKLDQHCFAARIG